MGQIRLDFSSVRVEYEYLSVPAGSRAARGILFETKKSISDHCNGHLIQSKKRSGRHFEMKWKKSILEKI